MNESSSVRLACYGIHKKLPFVVVASRSGYLGCYVGMSKKIRKMFTTDMMDENITYDSMDPPSVEGIPSKPHAEWWIGFSTYGINKKPFVSVPSVEVLNKYFFDIDEREIMFVHWVQFRDVLNPCNLLDKQCLSTRKHAIACATI